MIATVQKWGNSNGVRLTRQVLEEAHLAPGDKVEVSVKDGMIIIVPSRRIRGRHSLEELVAQIPLGYRAEEISTGKPVGKEAW